jgi:hypothetical protein
MTHDLDLELVRELHPQSGDRDAQLAVAARERARAALIAEIESAERRRVRPQRLPSNHPWLRPRRLAPLGLLGVAVAVGVALALALSLRGGAANPPSAAALVLQRAARTAAATGGPRELRPGEYWYVKSVWTTNGATVADPSVRGGIGVIVAALTTYERQEWIGVNRPGLTVQRVTQPITFLSTGAREQWIREGRPRQMPAFTRSTVAPDSFSQPYRQLLALPTNTDSLWLMLERHAAGGSPAERYSEMFTEIGDLLRYQPIPAKVRSALYLVAARIPEVRMLGKAHDDTGRPALTVALNDSFHGIWNELLFDPRSYVLLGERSVVVKPPPAYHVKPGSVRTGATYITSGIVERIGQTPRH